MSAWEDAKQRLRELVTPAAAPEHEPVPEPAPDRDPIDELVDWQMRDERRGR